MLFQLIRYDWTLLKAKLTDSETIIGVILMALFGIMIYSSVHNMISLALFAREGQALPAEMDFVTADVRLFILLIMANLWWLSQLFITGPSMLQPAEHRPLLTHGVTIRHLSSYLLNATFLHPFSLIFNIGWIVLLFAYSRSLWILILILPLLAANQLLIFAIKERFYYFVTKRAKQLALALFIMAIAFFQAILPQLNAPETIEDLMNAIPGYNAWLSWTPGGWMIQSTSYLAEPLMLFLMVVICLGAIYQLRSHLLKRMQKLILYVTSDSQENQKKEHPLWKYLKKGFGYQAKGLFYVMQHPYARFAMGIGLIFPLIYIPLMLSGESDIPESGAYFLIMIFTLMPLVYGSMLLLGNVFGYEYDEWLAHTQFPISIQKQLEQRFKIAAIILSGLLVVIVVGISFVQPIGSILKAIPSFFLILAELFLLFLWPAFTYLKRVPPKLMNFSNPLFPTSIGIVVGLLQVVVFAVAFVPYGPLEPYKPAIQTGLCLGIFWYLWSQRAQLSKRYYKNILPRLWSRS
jgi:hypothetical protein